MSLPALRTFASEADCKQYFVENYCNAEIYTHDGIKVKFHKDIFEHAFYVRVQKQWKSKKDHFSLERGERIDWIKYVLNDSTITPRQGYDKAKKRFDNSRRVAFLTPNNYVVIIQLVGKREARFVTAFIVDSADVANKINANPVWNSSAWL